MTPSAPLTDIVDGRGRYPEQGGSGRSGLMAAEDVEHVVFAQDCHPMPLAEGLSALADHVGLVLSLRSDEQVDRITAGTHVARMPDDLSALPANHLSAAEPRGHDVGVLHPAVPPELAVSVGDEDPGPEPASGRVGCDLVEEPLRRERQNLSYIGER